VVIDELFTKGQSFYVHPFKICWTENTKATSNIQVLVSVPKRIYKKAVDRNRVKRLIREAYRKNMEILKLVTSEKKIAIMLMYTSKTILQYPEIEQKLVSALKQLSSTIKKDNIQK
jgi:ribonuclease P protein component